MNDALLKLTVCIMFFPNLGVLIMNSWMHSIPLMIMGSIFVSLFAVIFGRTWWPMRKPEIHEISVPYPVPEPYPADKASHDYQMGYKDGQGDYGAAIAQANTHLPAGHPANPSNNKKPVGPEIQVPLRP